MQFSMNFHSISDLKKLMKYEQSSKSASKNGPQVIRAPENEINVTIIKEFSPKKCEHQPTSKPVKSVPTVATVEKNDIQTQTNQTDTEAEKQKHMNENKDKDSKTVVRLPSHIKNRNPKIVYKKGIVCGGKNGVLVRNTPTDLYKKYQEEWIKFKSFIPGENGRLNVRRSIRRKMQQKDDSDAKVSLRNKKSIKILIANRLKSSC